MAGDLMPLDLETRIASVTNPNRVPLRAADLANPTGAKVKGFAVVVLTELMDSMQPGLTEQWLATLPEGSLFRDRRSHSAVGWLPVELYFQGVSWLANQEFGGPRGALRIGYQCTRKDINAFFRFVLAFASPSLVMGLSGRFWRSYHDTSTFTVTGSSATGCTADLKHFPVLDEVALNEVGGSLIAWLEASRAKDVRLTKVEVVSKDLVQLEASWSP